MAQRLARQIARLIEDSALKGAVDDAAYDGPDRLGDAPVQAVVSLSSLGTQSERPVKPVQSGGEHALVTETDSGSFDVPLVPEDRREGWVVIPYMRVYVQAQGNDQDVGRQIVLQPPPSDQDPAPSVKALAKGAETLSNGDTRTFHLRGAIPPDTEAVLIVNGGTDLGQSVEAVVDGLFWTQGWEPQQHATFQTYNPSNV